MPNVIPKAGTTKAAVVSKPAIAVPILATVLTTHAVPADMAAPAVDMAVPILATNPVAIAVQLAFFSMNAPLRASIKTNGVILTAANDRDKAAPTAVVTPLKTAVTRNAVPKAPATRATIPSAQPSMPPPTSASPIAWLKPVENGSITLSST